MNHTWLLRRKLINPLVFILLDIILCYKHIYLELFNYIRLFRFWQMFIWPRHFLICMKIDLRLNWTYNYNYLITFDYFGTNVGTSVFYLAENYCPFELNIYYYCNHSITHDYKDRNYFTLPIFAFIFVKEVGRLSWKVWF